MRRPCACRSSHPPPRPRRGLPGRLGGDGSSSGGDDGGRRRRLLLLLLGLGPAVIRAGGRGPPMRLLAGWLCLSLASVWLARRMWTLRSPLSRSLYVNMTSGPGGPAAATGGGKDTHQVLGRGPAERGRGARPSRARPGHCAGRRARASAPASHKLFRARALAPRRLLFGGAGGGQPLLPGSPGPSVGAREPRIVPGRPLRPRRASASGLRTRATLGWATQLAQGPEQKTAPAFLSLRGTKPKAGLFLSSRLSGYTKGYKDI